MDLFVCAGLGLLESLLLDRFWTRNTPTGSTAAPVSPDVTVTVAQAAWSLFLAQYLALKYYRIFLYHKYFSPLRDVPGPSDNHFFFGQALKFYQADTPTELYIRWMREHPDAPFIRYLTWANTEVLVPNSLNANRDVVQTHCYSFSKPPWFLRVVKELGGRGVILMEGEEHRAHRKMLGAPFSLKNIRKLEPIFQEKATDICATFDRRIEESDDKRTGVIDCTDTFSKAILDIMGEAILGINLDYVKQQAGETNGGGGGGKVKGKLANGSSGGNDLTERYTFHEAYRQFFTPGTLGKFLLFANGFVSTRWLPLQANRDFLDAMGWLHEVLRSIIRDRNREVREAVAAGTWETKDSRDLITFIAEESLPGGVAEGIKEDDFLGHLLEFMAAGHDTSANMLSWSLYILVLHQDIQDKLREEVSQLPDNPTYTELEKLPYLENFCKESLRVYPTATTIHRKADVDLLIEGVHIPKETLIDLAPCVTLLNPMIWGDDVDEVDPSRWDRLTGDQLSPYTFSPFSNGPRICIGRSLALFEIKTILVAMVRNFRFIGVEGSFTVENPSFTLRPTGLSVRLERVHT